MTVVQCAGMMTASVITSCHHDQPQVVDVADDCLVVEWRAALGSVTASVPVHGVAASIDWIQGLLFFETETPVGDLVVSTVSALLRRRIARRPSPVASCSSAALPRRPVGT